MASLNLNVIITYHNSPIDFREGLQLCDEEMTFEKILKTVKSNWKLPCNSDDYDIRFRNCDDTEEHVMVVKEYQLLAGLRFHSRNPLVEFILKKVDNNERDVIDNITHSQNNDYNNNNYNDNTNNNNNDNNNSQNSKSDNGNIRNNINATKNINTAALNEINKIEQLFPKTVSPVIIQENLEEKVDTLFEDVNGSHDSYEIDDNAVAEQKEESMPFNDRNGTKALLIPLPPGLLTSNLDTLHIKKDDKHNQMKYENADFPCLGENSVLSIPIGTDICHSTETACDGSNNDDDIIRSGYINIRDEVRHNDINGNHVNSRNINSSNNESNDTEDTEFLFTEVKESISKESDGHLTSNYDLIPKLTARTELEILSPKDDDDQLFNLELESFKAHIINNGGILSLPKDFYLSRERPELTRLMKKRFSKKYGIHNISQIFLDNKSLGVKVIPATEDKPLQYCLHPSLVNVDFSMRQSVQLSNTITTSIQPLTSGSDDSSKSNTDKKNNDENDNDFKSLTNIDQPSQAESKKRSRSRSRSNRRRGRVHAHTKYEQIRNAETASRHEGGLGNDTSKEIYKDHRGNPRYKKSESLGKSGSRDTAARRTEQPADQECENTTIHDDDRSGSNTDKKNNDIFKSLTNIDQPAQAESKKRSRSRSRSNRRRGRVHAHTKYEQIRNAETVSRHEGGLGNDTSKEIYKDHRGNLRYKKSESLGKSGSRDTAARRTEQPVDRECEDRGRVFRLGEQKHVDTHRGNRDHKNTISSRDKRRRSSRDRNEYGKQSEIRKEDQRFKEGSGGKGKERMGTSRVDLKGFCVRFLAESLHLQDEKGKAIICKFTECHFSHNEVESLTKVEAKTAIENLGDSKLKKVLEAAINGSLRFKEEMGR